MEFSDKILSAYSAALAALYSASDREGRVAALVSALRPIFEDCTVSIEAVEAIANRPHAGSGERDGARSFTVAIEGTGLGLHLRRDSGLTAHQRFLAAELQLHLMAALDVRCSPLRSGPDPGSRPADLRGLGLTSRECEVLYWIALGRRDAEIAHAISAAVRTVNKHVENILRKLGVETRLAAARVAAEWLERSHAKR